MAALPAALNFEQIHRYALAAQFVAGKVVVDLAPRTSAGSSTLARTAASVVVISDDQDAVAEAQRAFADVGNIEVLHGAYGALPLDDQRADVVVSFEASTLSEHAAVVLREIKRILRPNGLLLLSAAATSVASESHPPARATQTGDVDSSDIVQMLQTHFHHVAAYAQKSNIASFVYPLEDGSQQNGFRFLHTADHQMPPSTVHDVPASLFIVASDGTLPDAGQMQSVHSDLTATADGYALSTLMGQLAQAYAEVDASRRMLASVQGSKFWKLRDAWFGVRDRQAWVAALVPPVQKTLWSITYNHRGASYPLPAMKLVMDTVVPPLQKALWGLTYNHFAAELPIPGLTFMNLGFVGGTDDPTPTFDASDEPNRLRIQLYHHVATQVDVRGRDVLEVGSGRGGGAAYVMRYLGPASMVGMDLADKAVAFCRKTHRLDGLRFVQGDAENLPFEDHQFDVVMNVESSHCYPSVEAFLREVKRVLRPGGHFLYADIMPARELPRRRQMLKDAGLDVLQERNITSNVLASLDSNADERVAWEGALTTVFGQDGAREWSMLPGSQTLDGMRTGTLCYVSMALRAG